MERLAMETANLTEKNIDKILELFPNVATEAEDENGNLKRAIDFDKLKQELSDDVVEGEEKYDFTWVGKNEAMLEANRPIRKTLRPVIDPNVSVDWENTQNIYIEGDNLDALKLLQESYLGKIKMIYIDPPYNTGKDFVYIDNFTQDKESYEKELGVKDEEGNRLFQNTETNGRFHSDWCSMIYSRLKLARNLLSEDGVIFISIDDNEVRNLKNICDEIFGEDNFIVELINVTGASQNGEGVKIQKNTESCLVYAKNYELSSINKVDKAEENLRNLNDAPSEFATRPDMGYTIYYNSSNADIIPIKDYDKDKINTNNESLVYQNDKELISKGYIPIRPGKKNGLLWRWRWGFETFKERIDEVVIKNGCVYFKQSGYNPPKNIINFTVGTSEIKELFDSKKIFDFPKSTKMIKRLISIGANEDSIILDFFSGSATTAHACMQLNAEDGGNRKFIMVQLLEKTDEKSEAFKAGYKNICEIGEERIRRAGKKIQEENPDKKIDVGFRVFKVDDTNMKDVYYSPSETDQKQLGLYESNIKDDRTYEDLLYGCLLDWGVELSLPHRVEIIDGKKVHIVDNDALIACFEENIPESVIRKIAGKKPMRVVFRDSSFNDDDNKINVEEIFKLITPDTTVKVI